LELRIQASRSSKPIRLRQSNVVEEGPEHIVAIAIVILVNSIIIQEHWNAALKLTKVSKSEAKLLSFTLKTQTTQQLYSPKPLHTGK